MLLTAVTSFLCILPRLGAAGDGPKMEHNLITPAPQPETQSTDAGGPRIEYGVTLPREMKDLLWRHDPDFEIWRQTDFMPSVLSDYAFSLKQTPSAVLGDFNGDRKPDLALLGRDKTHDLLIAIVSRKEGYRIMEIKKSPHTDPEKEWYSMGDHKEYGLSKCLTFAAPAKLASPHEREPLDMRADGFQANYFGAAAVLYYWNDGEFLEYVTAD